MSISGVDVAALTAGGALLGALLTNAVNVFGVRAQIKQLEKSREHQLELGRRQDQRALRDAKRMRLSEAYKNLLCYSIKIVGLGESLQSYPNGQSPMQDVVKQFCDIRSELQMSEASLLSERDATDIINLVDDILRNFEHVLGKSELHYKMKQASSSDLPTISQELREAQEGLRRAFKELQRAAPSQLARLEEPI